MRHFATLCTMKRFPLKTRLDKPLYNVHFHSFAWFCHHVHRTQIIFKGQTSEDMYKESWTIIILCFLPQSAKMEPRTCNRKLPSSIMKKIKQKNGKVFSTYLFRTTFFLTVRNLPRVRPPNLNAFYSILVFIVSFDAELFRASDFFLFFSFSHYF